MEKLKELLGEKLYGEVAEQLKAKGKEGKDLELAVANDGSFLPKAKFDALNKEYQGMKERVNGMDAELMGAEAAKIKALEMEEALGNAQKENENLIARYQGEIAEIAKKNSLEKVLNGYGAKNNRAVEALLDWEKIDFKDGELLGVNQQLEVVKEEAPYLFNSKTQGFTYQPKGSHPAPDYAQMSDADYYRFLNKKG